MLSNVSDPSLSADSFFYILDGLVQEVNIFLVDSCATPGEEVLGSIPTVAARSLLVESVSVTG